MNRINHTIDATNKVPGKLATTVAVLLMGKHKVSYDPHTDCGDVVLVKNVAALKLNKKKMIQKTYYIHTHYPGHLNAILAKDVPPAKMLRKAIYNMLPKNKLRAKMLRRLTIQ